MMPQSRTDSPPLAGGVRGGVGGCQNDRLSIIASHKNKPTDYRRAKKLRRDSTDGEQVLWYRLRIATKNAAFRFRRQYPIHPYIVDFVCLKLRLIVEVDGSSHDARIDADKKRDQHLAKMGYEVMRFSNSEVMKEYHSVVAAIFERATTILNGKLPTPPLAPPARGGEFVRSATKTTKA